MTELFLQARNALAGQQRAALFGQHDNSIIDSELAQTFVFSCRPQDRSEVRIANFAPGSLNGGRGANV
jgi:hypothetical protein